MTVVDIPCIRHGHPSARDTRLVELLAVASAMSGEDLQTQLECLLDYDGCLWATWREARARSVFSPVLAQAWQRVGGERGALHLIAVNDPYDYQEDIMNSAD